MTDLLPCPFCGGPPVTNNRANSVLGQIYCRGEECFGPKTTALTVQDSVVQWNTRAPQLATVAQGSPDHIEIKRLTDRLSDAQKIIAEYQASTIAGAKADVAAHVLPGARGQRPNMPIAAALARRLCQMFDSGGESQRSARARHASAIFQLLNRDDPGFLAEQAKCDADPVGYLQVAEGVALPSTEGK